MNIVATACRAVCIAIDCASLPSLKSDIKKAATRWEKVTLIGALAFRTIAIFSGALLTCGFFHNMSSHTVTNLQAIEMNSRHADITSKTDRVAHRRIVEGNTEENLLHTGLHGPLNLYDKLALQLHL